MIQSALRHTSVFIFGLTVFLACHRGDAADRPNIVILLADDLGYGDVGYHGSDIRTPNIDRIAAEGVRLERFYSCPMCSPTRAGLLTGRWPLRFGIMRAVIPPWRDYGLPKSEVAIPEVLAQAGYKRRGIIGKWHLGHSRAEYHPLEHGFTYFYGHYNGAIDYFTHEREGEVDWHRNRETVKEEGYSTDLLAADAARFIRESPAGEPYFLYVPFNAPHAPYEAKEVDLAKYPNRKGKKKTLAAMIDCLDQGVGTILRAIEERGDAENTFLLFFSDNGGVRNVASNKPLRGAKLTPYEGGIRVVACARYPRGGLSGGKVVEERMGYIDVFPTLLEIAQVVHFESIPFDGCGVLEAMAGRGKVPAREWFTYEAQNGNGTERTAVHSGEWKMVVHGAPIFDAPAARETRKIELFRIDQDPYEKTDVAGEHGERVGELSRRLIEFRKLQHPGVPAYGKGREGFVAPKDWVIGSKRD